MSPPGASLVVVLTGPTGSGKSELALRVAERLEAALPVEIISADSAQVYRGMDIGTAKPDAARRARVPHHLIDIRDPLESYSAGEFARDALAQIEAIHAREHLPLIVGGTLLYLRALYEGLAEMPPACPSVRAELAMLAQRLGWPALHAQLAELDPEAATRIRPQDTQRIQRALEVQRLTGVPISHWQQRRGPGARSRFRWLRYALLPEDSVAGRRALRARLEARFAGMLAAGLLEEVRGLQSRGDLTAQHASMRAVGYRQLWPVAGGDAALKEARLRAVTATAQLAKRQLTWLRGEGDWTALPAPLDEPQSVGLSEAIAAEILAAARA